MDHATKDSLKNDQKEGKVGCVACLQSGEFEFWHETEFGLLDENGFMHIYHHHKVDPPPTEDKKFVELRRTPKL